MKNPYFKWYPADAEMDDAYSSMTNAQVGMYHRLLNRAWINNGIPADEEEIRKMLHMDPRSFRQDWDKVRAKFERSPADFSRLVNPRMEKERQEMLAKSLANQRIGNANAFKSRSEKNANASQHALARAESVSVSESSEESKKKENLDRAREVATVSGLAPSIPAWGRDEQFMEFVVLFRQTGAALIDEDFAAAYQWAWSRLDFEQKAIRLVAIKEKLDADCYPDSQYVPKPQKFIQTEWKRPIARKQSARKFVLPPPIPPPPEIQALWDAADREKNKNAH